REMRTWLRLAVLGGAAALGLGAAVLCWPRGVAVGGVAGTPVAVLLGVWLLVASGLRVAESVLPGESGGGARALSAVAGLLYLSAGIVCVRDLSPSLELLAAGVGIVGITGGVSEVIAAVTGHRGGWARHGAVAGGATGVAGGVALAFWPAISLATMVRVTGAWLLAAGVVQVVLAVRASRPADF
ncbi:MAG TPA: DUF308 domain-containing protein, partial [Pilimelia sp.]|nr:DUF308 domain-containing protein [Pilimelia sp.]